MLEERMREIEARIRDARNLPESEREKLLTLVATLRRELATLPASQAEDAHSVTNFLEASTHEASRTTKHPRLLEAARDGLLASAEKFETTHPRLFDAAGQVALVLGNMGL